MRGNNKMLLNEATMLEAMQTYFDSTMSKRIIAVSVSFDSGFGSFVVETSESEESRSHEQ